MTPDQEQRLASVELELREHRHSGLGDTRVNFKDIFGKIEVVSAAPVGKPNDISGQLKIYTNGATLRFYWYDTVAGLWHYVTATA
jgi:hypothetical protein